MLPPNLVDILFLDGQKRELTFPFLPAEQGDEDRSRATCRRSTACGCTRTNRWPRSTSIRCDLKLPPAIFAPFSDQGQIVTPTYWGSHWPLARGKTTGWAIDDRVQFTPCHNSVMSWARSRPEPLRTAADRDARHARPLEADDHADLGLADRHERRGRRAAAAVGAQLRASPLRWKSTERGSKPNRTCPSAVRSGWSRSRTTITIDIKPATACVNPVFELTGASQDAGPCGIGRPALDADEYAWDGQTLWINATLTQDTLLRLELAADCRCPEIHRLWKLSGREKCRRFGGTIDRDPEGPVAALVRAGSRRVVWCAEF